MKRITFLFAFLFSFSLLAQLTQEDVVFYVGEGENTAYIVVDFRDGTPDSSFGWGVHFDGDDLTIRDAFLLLENEDSGFSFNETYFDGFGYALDDVFYNNHQQLAGEPDYWSTWTGTSPDDFDMNMGLGDPLENGGWYGFSYGFDPAPEAPTFKYAAYDADWLSLDDVDGWFGEGENRVLVTIDFTNESDSEEVSTFGWGLQFDGSITGKEALETLTVLDENLNISFDENGDIFSVSYQSHEETVADGVNWYAFAGTSMSDYALMDNLETELEDGQFFGISFGDENVRRPYIPMLIDSGLSVDHFEFPTQISIWPNPADFVLNVETVHPINQIQVIDMLGRVLIQTTDQQIDITNLNSGMYLIQIQSDKGMKTKRFIKK